MNDLSDIPMEFTQDSKMVLDDERPRKKSKQGKHGKQNKKGKKASITDVDHKSISSQFVKFYFSFLNNTDSSKKDLWKDLYRDYSKMLFCQQEFKGSAIFSKYRDVVKSGSKHTITQISSVADGSRRINVQVIGKIVFSKDGVKQEKLFTQYFQLCWLRDNKYWIASTIFSLI